MEHLRSTNVVFAIVMALLVVQSSTRPQPDELEEIKKTLYNACAGKFPITEEMKKDILNSNMVDDQNFKVLCNQVFWDLTRDEQYRCCFDEMSMIDEDGIIDGESLISMATDNLKPVIQQVVQSCVKDIKQDGCEAAFNFISCGLKLNPMTIQLLPL